MGLFKHAAIHYPAVQSIHAASLVGASTGVNRRRIQGACSDDGSSLKKTVRQREVLDSSLRFGMTWGGSE